jgi:hypothetical protein
MRRIHHYDPDQRPHLIVAIPLSSIDASPAYFSVDNCLHVLALIKAKSTHYTLSLDMFADFASFSSEGRFSYSKDQGFRVAIPRMNDWDFHRRASISELKTRLLPNVKLTRCGHIPDRQLARPIEQDYRYFVDSFETFMPY